MVSEPKLKMKWGRDSYQPGHAKRKPKPLPSILKLITSNMWGRLEFIAFQYLEVPLRYHSANNKPDARKTTAQCLSSDTSLLMDNVKFSQRHIWNPKREPSPRGNSSLGLGLPFSILSITSKIRQHSQHIWIWKWYSHHLIHVQSDSPQKIPWSWRVSGLISAPGHLLCRVQTHHRPGTSVVSTNVQKITSAKNRQACHGIAKPIGAHCWVYNILVF